MTFNINRAPIRTISAKNKEKSKDFGLGDFSFLLGNRASPVKPNNPEIITASRLGRGLRHFGSVSPPSWFDKSLQDSGTDLSRFNSDSRHIFDFFDTFSSSSKERIGSERVEKIIASQTTITEDDDSSTETETENIEQTEYSLGTPEPPKPFEISDISPWPLKSFISSSLDPSLSNFSSITSLVADIKINSGNLLSPTSARKQSTISSTMIEMMDNDDIKTTYSLDKLLKMSPRDLQSLIVTSDSELVSELIITLQTEIPRLSIHKSGNFTVQRLIERTGTTGASVITKIFLKNFLELSTNKRGCRVIQCFLEANTIERKEKEMLISTLEAEEIVNKLLTDANGTWVLQKLLKSFYKSKNDPGLSTLVTVVKKNFMAVSRDRDGCRVVQGLLSLGNELIGTEILELVLDMSQTLAHDRYGNYVLSTAIETGKEIAVRKIVTVFEGKFAEFSELQTTSKIVELCVRFGNEKEKLSIAYELSNSGNLVELSKGKCGNFVVQAVLEYIDFDVLKRDIPDFIEILENERSELENNTYGKHVALKIKSEIENDKKDKL